MTRTPTPEPQNFYPQHTLSWTVPQARLKRRGDTHSLEGVGVTLLPGEGPLLCLSLIPGPRAHLLAQPRACAPKKVAPREGAPQRVGAIGLEPLSFPPSPRGTLHCTVASARRGHLEVFALHPQASELRVVPLRADALITRHIQAGMTLLASVFVHGGELFIFELLGENHEPTNPA